MKKILAYPDIAWRLVAVVVLCLVGFLVDCIGTDLVKLADAIERLCSRIVKSAPKPPWL